MYQSRNFDQDKGSEEEIVVLGCSPEEYVISLCAFTRGSYIIGYEEDSETWISYVGYRQ
jgi:hypothetical protein